MLEIFYLKKISYLHVYKKKNRPDKWELISSTNNWFVSMEKETPLYLPMKKTYLNKFLEIAYPKRELKKLLFTINIMLLQARVHGISRETRYVLRWMALETLIREKSYLQNDVKEKLNSNLSELKKVAGEFVIKIKNQEVKKEFEDIVRQAEKLLTVKEYFNSYANNRDLEVIFEDIKPHKKLRDKIIHYGIIPKNRKKGECNQLSLQLENLVRNLIVDLLSLKMDPDWKIIHAWGDWKPQPKS